MDDLMVRMADLLRWWVPKRCDGMGRWPLEKWQEANKVLAEYDALKAQPSLVKSGDGVEQPTQPDVVTAVPLTDDEVALFLSVALRHVNFSGELAYQDIRDGLRVVQNQRNAASPSTADVAEARPALSGETGITNDAISVLRAQIECMAHAHGYHDCPHCESLRHLNSLTSVLAAASPPHRQQELA